MTDYNGIIYGTIGKLLREELSANIQYVMEVGDPLTRDVVLNTARVESTVGRRPSGAMDSTAARSLFTVQHPLEFGRSGTIKYANPSTALNQARPPIIGNLATTATGPVAFPQASTVPQRATEWVQFGLKWMLGNLVIDDRQMMAMEHGNCLEDFLSKWVKDPAEIIHQQLTTDLLSPTGGLGRVGVQSGALAPEVTGQAVYDTAGEKMIVTFVGSVRPFWRGQMLSFIDSTDNAVEGLFVVNNVHSYGATDGTPAVKVGMTTITASTHAPADTDVWILAGPSTYTDRIACSGFSNWVVDPGAAADIYFPNTGAVAGGVPDALLVFDYVDGTYDIWYYPELQSYVDVPTTTRFPVPAIFEKGATIMADRGWSTVKRWAVPRSVRSLWFHNESLYKVYTASLDAPVQTGASGGARGQLYIDTVDGERAEVVSSAFFQEAPSSGMVCWGYDPADLVRYAPNGVEGVQFLGQKSLLGNQMFMPTQSIVAATAGHDTAFTTLFQAPFSYWTEMSITKPQNIAKMGGFKTLADVV
jgi:hypothetical protein